MRIDPQHHRRVLMIAHAFPPTGGSGVQRPAKFIKYLPQFGWTPHVWATDHIPGLPIDPTLCNDLPSEVTIHRFANPDRLRAIAKLHWRLNRMIVGRLPDDAITWARASVRPLLKLIKQERIDLLFSTFSPASCHWLALQLKRRTGVPWVADFRDLWTDDCRYRESLRRRAAHRELEDTILNEADIVVGVTPSQTELLACRVPGQKSKFITITNGFDPADFANDNSSNLKSQILDSSIDNRQSKIENPATARNQFILAHIGRLDAHRVNDEFFAALRAFAIQLGTSLDRFVLRIIGHCNEQARQRLCETGIHCEFVDYVTHAESIREMCAANALLLLLPTGPNAETIIAGKVFEYLAAHRPILAIGPTGSESLRIVADYQAGITIPFNESEIVAALEMLSGSACADSEAAGEARPTSMAQLQSFSRIELTRQLADVFDHLVGHELENAKAPSGNAKTLFAAIKARSVSDGSTRTPIASDGPAVGQVLPAVT